MKREIKFRAWGKNKKEMSEVREIHFDQYGGIDVYCSGDDINTIAKGKDDLMQYTGLKDKNGKEIYEGDIILDVKGRPMIVELKRGAFAKNAGGGIFIPILKEDEIVGNIYSNPELLK